MQHPQSTPLATHFERMSVGGIDVLVAPRPGTGLAAATLLVRRGSADELASEHGLASFTLSMLMRGTRSRSRKELAYAFESIGAMIGESGGTDHCSLGLRVAASELEPALGLMFEALCEPAFDAREMEIERAEVMAHLRMMQDEKFGYTYREYQKAMFAGHGYGHPSEGEEVDVAAIDADACRSWHQETFRPEACMLVICGDVTPAGFEAMLRPHMKGWRQSMTMRTRQSAEPGQERPREVELTRDDLQQGFVIAGYRTPTLGEPDFPALRLASAALGEGFAGRIFSNLRDKRGLAYACGAALRFYRLAGHQVTFIGTKPESIDEARDGLLEEADYLRQHRLTDEELERAREFVLGKYLMGMQSHGQRAGRLAAWEDKARAELAAEWPERLREVTAEQVQAAVQRWWVDPTIAVMRPKD